MRRCLCHLIRSAIYAAAATVAVLWFNHAVIPEALPDGMIPTDDPDPFWNRWWYGFMWLLPVASSCDTLGRWQ